MAIFRVTRRKLLVYDDHDGERRAKTVLVAGDPVSFQSAYGEVGQAILVHNADVTLVTAARPLVRGEFAFLYAAGLGKTSNQPLTGAGASASPLATTQDVATVTIGGIPCDVQSAAFAPGLVGVYQVNFRVPPNAPAGSPDLVLTIGGASSPVVKALIQ